MWIPDDFLKIYPISTELRIRNTLLQKFFQTGMIYLVQFKKSTVKFGKCFAEFMIPIALLKELVARTRYVALSNMYFNVRAIVVKK